MNRLPEFGEAGILLTATDKEIAGTLNAREVGRHQPYRIPELSAGLQRTLAALCSYVDHHHPEKTICATKERLARDQLLHRSTLYRHLHQLEALGLITREAQARQSQRFVRSRLQLTPKPSPSSAS